MAPITVTLQTIAPSQILTVPKAVSIRKLYLLGVVLVLAFFHGEVAAQSSLDRWAVIPEGSPPIAIGRTFDLAFGADQLPRLAFIDGVHPMLFVKKWNGNAWTFLASLDFEEGQAPLRVRMASNWAGDIIVGLLMRSPAGIQIYQLTGSQLRQLGPVFPVAEVSGYDVLIDARGPVVAWQTGGFITVRRWNGVGWGQLGPKVNPSPNIYQEPQSPTLAVTGDGKLVVAYAQQVGDAIGIAVTVWDGTAWTTLGTGVPSPAQAVSLGGENSGAPVAAYLSGESSRVSRWNGSTWEAIGQPCTSPTKVTVFGIPSLTVRGNQPLVVCGIHISPHSVIGRRTLVARTWSRLSGWKPIGRGSINAETALPGDLNNLAYVVRSDQRGQPWVVWTGQSGVFVSTLVPTALSPGG